VISQSVFAQVALQSIHFPFEKPFSLETLSASLSNDIQRSLAQITHPVDCFLESLDQINDHHF
jgi:hypothetical protein